VPARSPMQNVGVRPGYEELFGQPATWQGVDSRLRQYGLNQVLDNLGRISAIVYNAGVTDLAAQRQLCHQLLGDQGPAAWRRVEEIAIAMQRETGHIGAIALFDDVSLATAAKRAFAVLDTASPQQDIEIRALAEALLMLNNLVERTALTPSAEPKSEKEYRSWIYYFVVAALFQFRPDPLYAMVRFHDLFLTDRPHLQHASGYLNLPALAQQTTGLPPQTMWAILVAMLSHFHAVDRENAHGQSAIVNRSVYFAERYTFDAQEVDSFFQLVARDATIVQG
jgi:hypothetical protein